MRKKKIQILLSVAVFLFLMDGALPVKAQERKLGRVERRADRNFVRQKFNKAMAQYETALKKEENMQNQAALHLKIARLYFMVRDYSWAIGHYEKAMELERNLFLVDDVCDYIDALRFQGQARKAEAICLNNAYKAQDLDEMLKLMEERDGNSCDPQPGEMEDLLDNRNKAWIEKMPSIMKETPTLFVVGAGHLPGTNGVLKLLKEKGYTVEPMK